MATKYAVQVVSGGEIQETQPGSLNAALNDSRTATEKPGVRVNDGSQKGAVSIRDGVASFDQHGPTRVVAGESGSSDPLDNGRNAWGNLIPRSALKSDSIIKLQAIEGDLGGFERLGMIEKGPDGLYRLTGQNAQSQQQTPQQQQTQQTQRQEQAPVRENLAPEVEADIQNAVSRFGETTVFALFEDAVRGGDGSKSLPQLATQAGMEPERTQEVYARVVDGFRQQAMAAAATAGVSAEAWEDFVAWAKSERAEATREAEEQQFYHSRTDGVKKLAAEYASVQLRGVKASDLNPNLFGPGVKITGDPQTGEAILHLPAPHGSMTLYQAVRLGLVKLSRS